MFLVENFTVNESRLIFLISSTVLHKNVKKVICNLSKLIIAVGAENDDLRGKFVANFSLYKSSA